MKAVLAKRQWTASWPKRVELVHGALISHQKEGKKKEKRKKQNRLSFFPDPRMWTRSHHLLKVCIFSRVCQVPNGHHTHGGYQRGSRNGIIMRLLHSGVGPHGREIIFFKASVMSSRVITCIRSSQNDWLTFLATVSMLPSRRGRGGPGDERGAGWGGSRGVGWIERDLGQFLFVLYLFLADSVTFSARLLQSILVFSSRFRLTSYSRHEVTLCGWRAVRIEELTSCSLF